MDLQKLLKQAQKMQGTIQQVETECNEMEYTASAGGNDVKVTIKGTYELISLDINEDLLEKDNKEIVEDLIKVAINSAVASASKEREEKMGEVTAGVKMPGMF